MNAAEVICRPHHRLFEGIDFEYVVTRRRWMPWRVRAKSGTSLERWIKIRRATILLAC